MTELEKKKSKLRISVLPAQSIAYWAKLVNYGIKKHGVNTIEDYSIDVYIDAVGRHYIQFLENPEGFDEESGVPHSVHLASSAMYVTQKIAEKNKVKCKDIIYEDNLQQKEKTGINKYNIISLVMLISSIILFILTIYKRKGR